MGQIASSGIQAPSNCSAKCCSRRRRSRPFSRRASSRYAANGTVYEEMHVDGGATREVFLLPTQIVAKNVDSTLNVKPIRRTYIIRNGRVGPEWKAVKPRTLSIAGRSISTLIKNQGIGDLYELYAFSQAQRRGLQPHLHSERFSRHEHPGLRPGLYDEALRSRLPNGEQRQLLGRRCRRAGSTSTAATTHRHSGFSLATSQAGSNQRSASPS